MEVDLNHVPKLCCKLAAMHYQLEQINPKIERKGVMSVIVPLILAGFCCLFMLGCGITETVSPEITERAAELSSGSAWQKALDSHANALATTLAAQKLTGEQTLETAQAIMAKLNTLEASLVKSNPNGKEVIQSAPESTAKANTTPDPLKVATPGTSQESLVELASRLYASGVNVNNRTREELEAIDANFTASKSLPVQFYSRPTYSEPAGTVCVNGRCFVPQVSSRRRR